MLQSIQRFSGGAVLGFRVHQLVACLALFAALTSAGCSAHTTVSEHAPVTSADLRAQLDALATPEGVSPLVFSQLKQALSSAIDRNVVKTVAAPPTKPNAAVDDFDAAISGDHVLFTWHYRNPGDFNQDGEVNISDLSALGKYLGATPNSANWLQARAADGNGDGEVNVSDLTTLGSNLLSSVEGYQVRYSATPADAASWQTLLTVPLGDAVLDRATGQLRFTGSIGLGDLPTRDAYFVTVPFSAGQPGVPSNAATLINLPPAIAKVSPLSGKSGAHATFSAQVYGSGSLTYAWNFGGGATPNTSDSATPSVTLGAPGSYTGTLTVSGQTGQDTFTFAYTIIANRPPTVSLTANPTAGPGPLTTVLSATADDPDGSIAKYEWDLDGDGKFETSGSSATQTATLTAPGAHTLGVRVTDDGGASATDTVSVTVASQPAAALTANATSVTAPDPVTFDASGSKSPSGEIVKYDWDWDGNGTIDATTKTPTFTVPFDAPSGIYKSSVTVTDKAGGTGSATVKITVLGTKFVAPPVEAYQELAGPNATPTQRWQKNAYSTLPEWRDANGPYQSAYFDEWSNSIFTLMNAQRRANGLKPVERLPVLDLFSQATERDMALRGFFSHTAPDGFTLTQRLMSINPPKTLDDWGEVIAEGQESPDEAVTQWMNSPEHRAIILDGTMHYCGVGVYWKTNGVKGLESYNGIIFVTFKNGGPPPAGYDWLEPDEVK